MSLTEKAAFKGIYASYLQEDEDDEEAVFAVIENEYNWKDQHTVSEDSLWTGQPYLANPFSHSNYNY